MGGPTEDLAFSLFALDQSVLGAADFYMLARSLVEWATRAGLAAAFVVTPDSQGWLRPGPSAGDGVDAYLHDTRMSIHDSCAEGRGPAGRAWRSQQLQVTALARRDDGTDARRSGEPVTRWRACATVPLADARQCIGLLNLFSEDEDAFTQPGWAEALAHIGLIVSVALDRLHLSVEQTRLRELSLQDALTGLPNMAALSLHLEQALARAFRAGIPLVVGLLDLDKFKPVNDLFGHEAGDDVLREIAARLRDQVRASDFVARRSGDEFVVVLEGVQDPEGVLGPFLERMYARLTQPVNIGSMSWQCGVSLGLSVWRDFTATSPDDALSEADRALRSVKIRGGEGEPWWCWATEGDVPEQLATGTRSDSDSYSRHWATELAELSVQLERNAAVIVNDFYQRLSRLPKSKRILDALDVPGLQHLKAQQIRNLFALADANLTEADHRATALRVGRIHAMVGLDREELVRSRGILASAVDRRLAKSVGREALQVFARRLNRDLAFQAEAYQFIEEERRRALSQIARVAWNSESYADLIARIVDILGTCDEVAGCAISRRDRYGVFRVESAAGRILAGRIVEADDAGAGAPHDLPLLASAWRSGNIERCINVSTDPAMTHWRSAAIREGLRSCVAIPLRQKGGAAFAVLALYSAFPGGYSSADQEAFIDLLQTLLSLAIGRFASHEGTASAIPHSTRKRWKALLQSDALQMYCQPIVELKTGRVTKVEMLARLDDGARVLTPGEFFPALRSGDFLDLYVRGLHVALSHHADWRRRGIELGVSLNLPCSALLDIRYFDATRQALEVHGCPPHMLTLELLEAEALPSDASVSVELARFKSLGVTLAEDDLGAGHSSLSRLRELPFDWIKIDRSIVSLAGHDASTVLSFIYQLTRLGHSLGKSVIVEGVESEELLEACKVLNVDAVQGYVLARPMPSGQLPEWLASRPAWTGLPEAPDGMLGKLARLLIWEERLHLVRGDLSAVERLVEVMRARASPQVAHVAQSSQQPFCRECRLSEFFTGIDTTLPDDETLTQALVDAAVMHGPRSAAYHAARRRVVSTFTIDSSAP